MTVRSFDLPSVINFYSVLRLWTIRVVQGALYKLVNLLTKKIEIENVQKWAMTLIIKINHLSYENRLHNFSLPTLIYRRMSGT